jgi:hypothetical protein
VYLCKCCRCHLWGNLVTTPEQPFPIICRPLFLWVGSKWVKAPDWAGWLDPLSRSCELPPYIFCVCCCSGSAESWHCFGLYRSSSLCACWANKMPVELTFDVWADCPLHIVPSSVKSVMNVPGWATCYDIFDRCGLVLTVTLYAASFLVIWGREQDRNMFSWRIYSKMENMHAVKSEWLINYFH